jgi:glycosyltransferase involved in cell wall biosynthesis
MIKFKNKVSIIIPVYNEKNTVEKLLNKIHKLTSIKKEIIVVDDASSDGTTLILKKNKKKITKLIYHKKNLGKGAAIKSAQKFVKGSDGNYYLTGKLQLPQDIKVTWGVVPNTTIVFSDGQSVSGGVVYKKGKQYTPPTQK